MWTVGLDERGTQSYDDIDYKMHCAIVLGAEGKGLHDLVRRRCDFLVSIPYAWPRAIAQRLGRWRHRDVRGGAAATGRAGHWEGQAVRMKRCLALTLFCAITAGYAPAIHCEAFSITRYQLEVQVDRHSHVMAVTGKLTLRNDSDKAQKTVALQVSSSLAWNSIMLDGKPLQWLSDIYTSDVDHTGRLSEAIITLPKELPPAGSVTLDAQYGGTIVPDATRLRRMGAPDDVAARNDWDQISDVFTAVRGLGYVVWYPVAIEAVSMSEGNTVFDAIAAWKASPGPKCIRCSHHRGGRRYGISGGLPLIPQSPVAANLAR